jgi:hypothetical protein
MFFGLGSLVSSYTVGHTSVQQNLEGLKRKNATIRYHPKVGTYKIKRQ